MVRATIKGFQQFDRITEQVERKVKADLTVAGEEARDEFARIARRRYRTGKMSTVRVIGPYGTPDGYAVAVANDARAFYDRFQNDGTLASRTKKLKAKTLRTREQPAGKARYAKVSEHKGIVGLKFKQAARSRGRRVLIARTGAR